MNDIEQMQLNIFDYSPLAYCVIEMVLDDNGQPVDGIFRYCNQALADITNQRKEDLVGHRFFDLFLNTHKKRILPYYQAAYENVSAEFDEIFGEGDRYLHIYVMPTGKRGYCACLIRDIRERYVLDKLCEDFTAVYHIELNSGRFDILKLGKNTNAKRMLGENQARFKNFDDYTKQYGKEYLSDEDREEFNDWFACKNLKKRLQNTERITYHYKSVPNGDSQRFFEAQAVKVHVEGNQFLVFMGFRYVDSILEKEREVQTKLQQALDEARLNSEIISAIAKPYQYISRIDLQADRFEEISNKDEFHRLTGVMGGASENAVNKCKKTVAEEYQQSVLQFLDLSTLPERLKNQDMLEMEYRMKDGNWHSFHFIAKKRDENGKVTHVLCAVRSISATKRKEQNLLNLAEKAEQDAAYKTRFLSNMSHDIRTPVNGIIGMVNLANHYPDDLEMQQKCRDKVIESSNYLVSMVDDILAMSKLEAGDTENYEMSFDLTDLLNSANTKAQIKAAEKNVDYCVDWGKADFKHQYLTGNPIFVERILHNLADNAIKFNRPGGSVHVWCKEDAQTEEHVIFEFGCSDDGIGMSEEFLPHAFEKFTQENESSRTKYEGTGLGLAIAKQLVDKLNGTIEMNSKKGIGTTCVVKLPFKISRETEIRRPAEKENISVAGLRALVVEDNELNMEIVKFMLEKHSITTICAVDGMEAVEIFEKSEPYFFDMIFMDIMMPRLNGLDATRKIRSLKRFDAQKIPVIAMSANAFADDIINSRISGMNLHLAKPLDEEKIVSAIKECIVSRKIEISSV